MILQHAGYNAFSQTDAIVFADDWVVIWVGG
jgi:hypothetical protein